MSTKPPALDMGSILADRTNRVVVCCGAGGVGKTTTAAAMAVRAAEYGRTVVVLTIDPANNWPSFSIAMYSCVPAREVATV